MHKLCTLPSSNYFLSSNNTNFPVLHPFPTKNTFKLFNHPPGAARFSTTVKHFPPVRLNGSSLLRYFGLKMGGELAALHHFHADTAKTRVFALQVFVVVFTFGRCHVCWCEEFLARLLYAYFTNKHTEEECIHSEAPQPHIDIENKSAVWGIA